MKVLFTLILLISTTFSCSNKQEDKQEKTSFKTTQVAQGNIFSQISDFPKIRDSTKFITILKKIFNLEVDISYTYKEEITTYKKVKIYGSEKDYLFIEYKYADGCGVLFPWRYQLLLTTDGKHIKTLSGLRYEFVEIFNNENPFLLTVTATSKGNGGHQLYKVTNDTLENVYECSLPYYLRTYDAHQDNMVNKPIELTFIVKDFNNDGLNDISFKGQILLIEGQTEYGDWFDGITINEKIVTYSIENPYKKVPLELIFLYHKESGHFKAKEDYSKKHELGNERNW